MPTFFQAVRINCSETLLRAFDIICSVLIFGGIANKLTSSIGISGIGGCWYGIDQTGSTGDASCCAFAMFSGIISFLLDLLLFGLVVSSTMKDHPLGQNTRGALAVASMLNTVFVFADCINLSIKYNDTCQFVGLVADCKYFKNEDTALAIVVFAWFSLCVWLITSCTNYSRFKGRDNVPEMKQQEGNL